MGIERLIEPVVLDRARTRPVVVLAGLFGYPPGLKISMNNIYRWLWLPLVAIFLMVSSCERNSHQPEDVGGTAKSMNLDVVWVDLICPGGLAEKIRNKREDYIDAAVLEKSCHDSYMKIIGDEVNRMEEQIIRISAENGIFPDRGIIKKNRLSEVVGGRLPPPEHPMAYMFSPEIFCAGVLLDSNGHPEKALVFSAFLGFMPPDGKPRYTNPGKKIMQLPAESWILDSVYDLKELIPGENTYYHLADQYESTPVPLIWLTGELKSLKDYPHGKLGPLTHLIDLESQQKSEK